MTAVQYVLIQMPGGEIKIEDNSTHIGKGRIEKLCLLGGVSAGTIESDLTRYQLKCGISHEANTKYASIFDKLCRLRKFVDEL